MIISSLASTDLDLSQSGGSVVGQTADPLSGVSVVEGVASVRGGQTKVTASFHRGNILKDN